MTSPAQHTDVAPSPEGASLFQLELLPPRQDITDALFDLHESGVTLPQLVTAWTWLDGLADAAGE